MGSPERDYRKDPVAGAGPHMGRVRAQQKLQAHFETWSQSRLADNECVHGTLPGDLARNWDKKCACWGTPQPTAEYLLKQEQQKLDEKLNTRGTAA